MVQCIGVTPGFALWNYSSSSWGTNAMLEIKPKLAKCKGNASPAGQLLQPRIWDLIVFFHDMTGFYFNTTVISEHSLLFPPPEVCRNIRYRSVTLCCTCLRHWPPTCSLAVSSSYHHNVAVATLYFRGVRKSQTMPRIYLSPFCSLSFYRPTTEIKRTCNSIHSAHNSVAPCR